MMVTLEALVSAWLFGHRVRTDLLAGLGRVASFVLSVYVLLRVGDLWHRGILPGAMDGSWQSGLFLFELAFSAVIPAALLASRRVRHSAAGLATCSLMVVLGIIGYRFNICIIAFTRPEGMAYWPTWTELAVSLGIVCGAMLVFIFFNENLRIVDHGEHGDDPRQPAPRPAEAAPLGPCVAATHSLVFVVAASLAIGFLPEDAIFGAHPRRTPAQPARNVEAMATPVPPPVLPDLPCVQPGRQRPGGREAGARAGESDRRQS